MQVQQTVVLLEAVPRGNVLVIASATGAAHEVVCATLARRGHTVDLAEPDVEAVEDFERYDLLILEIDAYDVERVQLCARLRNVTLVPLLVLVAETARSQGIQALDLGADTFMVVPFNKREMVARSEALVRRYRQLWSRPS